MKQYKIVNVNTRKKNFTSMLELKKEWCEECKIQNCIPGEYKTIYAEQLIREEKLKRIIE